MTEFIQNLQPDLFCKLSQDVRKYLLAQAKSLMLGNEISKDDRKRLSKALSLLLLHLNRLEQTSQIEYEIEEINAIQAPF
jgi:hypothetical protein